jgi:hypothetical protein
LLITLFVQKNTGDDLVSETLSRSQKSDPCVILFLVDTVHCGANQHNHALLTRRIQCKLLRTRHWCGVIVDQDTGFSQKHHSFWEELGSILRMLKVDFLCGDFNMALWRVIPELTRQGFQVTMLACYPWTCTRGGGATIQEADDEDDPEATGTTSHDEVRYDSCGIFALKPCTAIQRVYSPEDVVDSEKLQKFLTGQGYVIQSYVDGQTSMEASLQSIHVSGDSRIRLPTCSQKLVRMDMWDPSHELWNRGGHMPLLVYIGDNPYRRNESLVRREGGHIRRGWGPGSKRRSDHMQRSGHGPRQARSADQTAASAPTHSASASSEAAKNQPAGSDANVWTWSQDTCGGGDCGDKGDDADIWEAVLPPRVLGGLAEKSAIAENLG